VIGVESCHIEITESTNSLTSQSIESQKNLFRPQKNILILMFMSHVSRNLCQTSKCDWEWINMTCSIKIVEILYDTSSFSIFCVCKCLLNIISRFTMSQIINGIFCTYIKDKCTWSWGIWTRISLWKGAPSTNAFQLWIRRYKVNFSRRVIRRRSDRTNTS